MSEQRISEMDAVKRERAAALRAARYYDQRGYFTPGTPVMEHEKPLSEITRRIDEWYPLPHRVVSDPHEAGIYWRIDVLSSGDKIMMVKNVGDFESFYQQQNRFGLTEQRAAMWLDLYQHPFGEG